MHGILHYQIGGIHLTEKQDFYIETNLKYSHKMVTFVLGTTTLRIRLLDGFE